MKESTGEFSMTIITIAAIALISLFVGTTVWPTVSTWIENQMGTLMGN